MAAAFEASFARALLDAAAPVPDAVTAADAPTATRRFAVYRNNVVAGLANTLRSRFPATEKIVGEEFFAAMARAFVTEKPPRTPLLAAYGDEFPAFVAAFAPARELPYLADVAQSSRRRARVPITPKTPCRSTRAPSRRSTLVLPAGSASRCTLPPKSSARAIPSSPSGR